MVKCKITVLKRTFHPEFAEEYCKDPQTGICTAFVEGDEFITESSTVMPDGFCHYAWIDLHRILLALMAGGNFGTWMKDEKTNIVCCTDGIRPVIFKLERIEE
ncbi:MAG: TIGR04076 family protein [Promethearchaeota archaeon]